MLRVKKPYIFSVHVVLTALSCDLLMIQSLFLVKGTSLIFMEPRCFVRQACHCLIVQNSWVQLRLISVLKNL